MARRARIGLYIHALENGDDSARRKAASKLGKPSSLEALEPLCKALDDPVWHVRRNAARSLGVIGSKEAVEPLFSLLADRVMSVRSEAVSALGILGDPAAAEPLCRMLTDKKEQVRTCAMVALARIGLPAIPALCLRLKSGSRESGQSLGALQDIVRVHGPSALHSLLGAATLTPDQRWYALFLLHDYREHLPPFSAVRRQLADPRRFCEIAAASNDEALRRGARAVLEYTTLARASQRSLTTEQGQLLRAAQGSAAQKGSAMLLRASEGIEETAEEDHSFWARLRRWLNRSSP